MAKLVTKGRLIEAMEGGRTEGYNHLIDEAVINSLDPAHHYPVLAAIPHKHKQGERSRAHTRLLVEIKTRCPIRERHLFSFVGVRHAGGT